MFRVLALDLEGTLISNAMSQIPRPGLFAFLEHCREIFPRVVIFTTVDETRFRAIARVLVEERYAPAWFQDMEFVEWQGKTKDLNFIAGAEVASTLLIDDFEVYVHPGQEAQWVPIEYYAPPYSTQDTELAKVMQQLEVLVTDA